MTPPPPRPSSESKGDDDGTPDNPQAGALPHEETSKAIFTNTLVREAATRAFYQSLDEKAARLFTGGGSATTTTTTAAAAGTDAVMAPAAGSGSPTPVRRKRRPLSPSAKKKDMGGRVGQCGSNLYHVDTLLEEPMTAEQAIHLTTLALHKRTSLCIFGDHPGPRTTYLQRGTNTRQGDKEFLEDVREEYRAMPPKTIIRIIDKRRSALKNALAEFVCLGHTVKAGEEPRLCYNCVCAKCVSYENDCEHIEEAKAECEHSKHRMLHALWQWHAKQLRGDALVPVADEATREVSMVPIKLVGAMALRHFPDPSSSIAGTTWGVVSCSLYRHWLMHPGADLPDQTVQFDAAMAELTGLAGGVVDRRDVPVNTVQLASTAGGWSNMYQGMWIALGPKSVPSHVADPANKYGVFKILSYNGDTKVAVVDGDVSRCIWRTNKTDGTHKHIRTLGYDLYTSEWDGITPRGAKQRKGPWPASLHMTPDDAKARCSERHPGIPCVDKTHGSTNEKRKEARLGARTRGGVSSFVSWSGGRDSICMLLFAMFLSWLLHRLFWDDSA